MKKLWHRSKEGEVRDYRCPKCDKPIKVFRKHIEPMLSQKPDKNGKVAVYNCQYCHEQTMLTHRDIESILFRDPDQESDW